MLRVADARERQVMEMVISGGSNKQAAAELGISEITIKVHRGRVMRRCAPPPCRPGQPGRQAEAEAADRRTISGPPGRSAYECIMAHLVTPTHHHGMRCHPDPHEPRHGRIAVDDVASIGPAVRTVRRRHGTGVARRSCACARSRIRPSCRSKQPGGCSGVIPAIRSSGTTQVEAAAGAPLLRRCSRTSG